MPPDIPSGGDMPLTADMRREVLEGVLSKLDAYVRVETAETLQQSIRDRLQTDGYSEVKSAAQLAELLTAQLQTISGDRNLRLYYSPEPLPQIEPHSAPTPAELGQQRQVSSLRNFDFNRVERLSGNVGYLELYGFEPPEFAGETAIAAMNFLAHTSALIIDIRHNSGGSPAMVALLCSYLLPAYPPIHLNDLYWREDDKTQQWWTIPYLPGNRYLEKPVYVLTSQETFSAAEEFAYNLKALRRITIVGETTRGGANPGGGKRLNDHFWLFVPTGRAINPVTETNWEGSGILPNVKVPSELACTTAHLIALQKLLEAQPPGSYGRELQQSLYQVEKALNEQRQNLISQLGGR
ncbi:MAG: S41 family peptidase [Leptolyngbyaceae cyanobacterium SL_1_1]|nr:S41 family peptidase [Leptolyngbyaceae cyanobacterium RM1_1_2]NJO10786.1 S41 family peptidase [Leptolyngbyaceae cyanobacterium SL_1_1]